MISRVLLSVVILFIGYSLDPAYYLIWWFLAIAILLPAWFVFWGILVAIILLIF